MAKDNGKDEGENHNVVTLDFEKKKSRKSGSIPKYEMKKPKRGRPPTLTLDDPYIVKELTGCAHIQATVKEAAAVLGVHHMTLSKWLNTNEQAREIWDAGRDFGRQSIRRKQYEVALKGKGNVTMLIWLGKQDLGQTDQAHVTQDVTVQNVDAVKELRAKIDAMRDRMLIADGSPTRPEPSRDPRSIN